jgi:uncharacterized repeat protein (TIGR01451 family)
MKKLLIILCVLSFQNVVFGQGWQRILGDSLDIGDACNSYDGGCLISGSYQTVGFTGMCKVIKINSKGIFQWGSKFSDIEAGSAPIHIMQSPDSLFLLYGIDGKKEDFFLKKINEKGSEIWTKRFPVMKAIIKSNKMGYIIVGSSSSNSRMTVFLRLNLNGDTISHKMLNTYAPIDFEIQNDGLLCFKNYLSDTSGSAIYKTDFNGELKWFKNFPPREAITFQRKINSQDTSYYIGTSSSSLLKVNKNGDTIWVKQSSSYQNLLQNVILSNGNGLIGSPNKNSKTIELGKFDGNGDNVWKKRYDYEKTLLIRSILRCENGGYLVVGSYNPIFFDDLTPIFLLKIDENGNVYTNNLEGKIIKDINKNCQINPTDTPFKESIIEAKNTTTGNTFWGLSDAAGNYTVNLDSGQYTIKAYPRYGRDLWQTCTPSVSKTFSSVKKVDTLDFLLSPIVECPALEVSMTTPILRRCFENTYTVKYCNKGTMKADNAYITVTLDSLLEFISASQSISSRSGRTYRFNIGSVAVDDCRGFDIVTRVRCGDSTRLGQTLCAEARIFPDTICTSTAPWSGANLVVTGTCLRDSVLFQIRNTGTAPSSTRNAVVIEDEVLFLQQPIQLPQNGVFTRQFPANGKTWRMAVQQEPNHPTSSNPTAFVEGCRSSSSAPFSTGFAPLFANDDRGLSIDIDCQQIRGAYDPNDKQGFPFGYKAERFVAQNQDIEYLIRFQNTGTDTAFTVTIRDTISDKLDISSIEFGASSHAYTPEIYGKNVLKFMFNNIKLVDSFKNEPKSHGFVQFRVKQQKDLAWGTKIYNNAGIYFDFNDPIITNRTLHTVGGKEVISAIVEKNKESGITIKVSPNPFVETATFELPLSISGNFELYNIAGIMVRQERFEGKTCVFQRNGLSSGVYIFKILDNGKTIGIGKLIVH